MFLEKHCSIFLPTYNRKKYLARTLEQLTSADSPVRNCSITILDNASTDGTDELIEQYVQQRPNIKHIRHAVNIGGNANIARAFELGASCSTDYIWGLCDDDKYDFSNWAEAQTQIKNRTDIICVSDHCFPSQKDKTDPAYQLFQMAFVPGAIYKRNLLTDNVLQNMYNTVYALFPHICPGIECINLGGTIKVLKKPVVLYGLHFEDKTDDISYTRGYHKDQTVFPRIKDTIWHLGYANVLPMLKDKKLREEALRKTILFQDKGASFYNLVKRLYIKPQKNSYFYEIYEVCSSDIKRRLFWMRLAYQMTLPFKWLFEFNKEDIEEGNSRTVITVCGVRIPLEKKGHKAK